MTVPTGWPLGRLTMRSTPTGQPGHVLTRDELAADVLILARQQGYRPTRGQTAALLAVESRGEGRLVGTVHLEPAASAALAAGLEDAVTWLNAHAAPPGCQYVVRDGLYLDRQQ